MSVIGALVTYGTCFVSAFVPVVNAEAYLLGVAAFTDVSSLWVLALMAALGQMTGKLVFYCVGRGALALPWVARKGERAGRWRARLEAWQARANEHRVWAFVLVAVSAFIGLPPFALVSVLAGTLRLRALLFTVLGLAGRFARFSVVLAVPGLTSALFGWP
ncbi:MAG: hypothetical protein ACRDN9_17035 [Streptosporangiaceae bacterium]